MASESESQLLGSVASLLDTGEYSDCLIRCGPDEYKVHKAILCQQSSFFKAAFSLEMKEKATGTVSLDAEDHDVVRSLVDYMCRADYTPRTKDNKESEENEMVTMRCDSCGRTQTRTKTPETYWCCPKCKRKKRQSQGTFLSHSQPQFLAHHARLYALAEMYQVKGLKAKSQSKFADACSHFCDSEEFAGVITEVYSTTPEEDRGLRDIIIQSVRSNFQLLDKDSIKTVLKDIHQFSYNVNMMFRENQKQSLSYY